MNQTTEELLRGPDRLENIFIHRKNKNYIIAKTIRHDETGTIEYQCLESDTGLNGIAVTTGIFAPNILPKVPNNIYVAAANLGKYLSKNGYKSVTTIIQTKNGVKLK